MPEAPTRERAREICRRALHRDEFAPLRDAERRGMPILRRALALVPRVRHLGRAACELREAAERLAAGGVKVGQGVFEQFVVLTTALKSVDRVPRLPVDDGVKQLFYKKFVLYANGAPGGPLTVQDASFIAMCRIASLTRFPAGQLDWLVSGVPRSWLLKVPKLQLPKLLKVISLELGGFAPMFFSHLDPHRPNQGMLLERESLRSYHRMARSIAMQPRIKGFVTASWFHSPDTFAVSPHLKWVNDVFLGNGGYVFPLGPADPDCGVLHRSPERQEAFERGTFVPTEALVVWPREAMLAWAEGRQDLVDARARRQPSFAGARA